MKRALAAALTAALFMTLLVGMASAEVVVTSDAVADRPHDVESDQVHDFNIRRLLHKCWRVLHSDDASSATKERCAKIIKRWCHSHPDSRICHRPPPPPHCRPIDRVTDLRCCFIIDRVTDLRCHPIDPPRPCPITVDVPHTGAWELQRIHPCQPIDRPTDTPSDRPSDQPSDRPSDEPSDSPVVWPDDTSPKVDGILDDATDRPKDNADDSYVGADSADL